MASAWMSQLESVLWPRGYSRDAWMLVDAARDRRIFGLLLECFYSDHSCLFSGPLTAEIEVVAPYLVHLNYDDAKTRKFLALAWQNGWGLFLNSDARLDVLRRHLRTLLMVRHYKGNVMMFRYYDPRIMRIYLPTCNSEELRTVFGPIGCFLIESSEPGVLQEYSYSKGRMEFQERRLA
jgi:hypothetical protein